MKVLVLGNCQARPMAQILSRAPSFEALDPIILHLSHAGQAEEHHAQMAQADLILAQFTNPAFKPDHLAAGTVARNWPEKTLIWPNLFYSGQQPFLRYLTHPEYGRLFGPFEAVHDLRLLLQWHYLRNGSPVLNEIDTARNITRIHTQSLATLREREAACDIIISDLIDAHHAIRRLFFTFNHPCRWLLEALCCRIAERIGVALPEIESGKEPLDLLVVPSTWHHFPEHGVTEQTFRGMQITLQPGGKILSKGRQNYTLTTLRETAFRCFDHMAPHLDLNTLRLTPKMGTDPAPLLSDLS